MSLADVERLAEERPGSDFVAGDLAARRLAAEARDARKLLSRRVDDEPDVVARIGAQVLRIRATVPSGVVYVVRAVNVPMPTAADVRLAAEVAKIVQSL